MAEVRERRRGTSRITVKNQITIPVDALREAGLEPGERLTAHADGPGRIVLQRADDVVSDVAGSLTGVYRRDELDRLRDEWG